MHSFLIAERSWANKNLTHSSHPLSAFHPRVQRFVYFALHSPTLEDKATMSSCNVRTNHTVTSFQTLENRVRQPHRWNSLKLCKRNVIPFKPEVKQIQFLPHGKHRPFLFRENSLCLLAIILNT